MSSASPSIPKTYHRSLSTQHARELAPLILRGQVRLPAPRRRSSNCLSRHFYQLSKAYSGARKLSPAGEAMASLLDVVLERSRFLHSTLSGLCFLQRLLAYRAYWRNDPADWQPPLHPGPGDAQGGLHWQARDLLHFLFVAYPLPAWMDQVWFRTWNVDHREMEWYVQLTAGASVRRLAKPPIPLSKRMAHLTLQAPALSSLKQAMHWARLRTAGLESDMAERAVIDPWGCDPDNGDLLVGLARLVEQSGETVAPQEYSIFFRYLEQCCRRDTSGARYRITVRTLDAFRFDLQEHLQRRWTRERNQAPAPVRRSRRVYALPANPRVAGFETVDAEGVTVRIVELRKSYQLEIEGRRMSHCVGTYITRCRNGRSNIWSLRRGPHEATLSLATIEVDPERHEVVQVRAQSNANPSRESWAWIRRWAEASGLKMRTD